jgi:hypothetical protein
MFCRSGGPISAGRRIFARAAEATTRLKIAKYIEKRTDCTTSRCGSTIIAAALHQLARGSADRRAAEARRRGPLVAFIHPSSAHGVLVELKQSRRQRALVADSSAAPAAQHRIRLAISS